MFATLITGRMGQIGTPTISGGEASDSH